MHHLSRLSSRACLGVALLVSACSDGTSSTSPDAAQHPGASPDASSPQRLDVTIDGKPMTVRSVSATYSPSFDLVAVNATVACATCATDASLAMTLVLPGADGCAGASADRGGNGLEYVDANLEQTGKFHDDATAACGYHVTALGKRSGERVAGSFDGTLRYSLITDPAITATANITFDLAID